MIKNHESFVQIIIESIYGQIKTFVSKSFNQANNILNIIFYDYNDKVMFLKIIIFENFPENCNDIHQLQI